MYPNFGKWPVGGSASVPFYFPSLVRFDGAYFAGLDFSTATFQLYNSGSLVATSGTLIPSSTPTFLASGYTGLVDEVRVVSDAFRVMDNVTYNTDIETVPEPSTILGLGLLGLGAFCNRQLSQGKKSKQDNWVEKFGISFNKFLIGVYVQMNYQASGKQVATLERAMGLSDEVILYLTLKLDRVVAPLRIYLP